jgi:hypothetical protein
MYKNELNWYICMCEKCMCKNLEYISLLQSRAILAEPSKMHRNQPLAVHPATTYKYKEAKKPQNRAIIKGYAFI